VFLGFQDTTTTFFFSLVVIFFASSNIVFLNKAVVVFIVITAAWLLRCVLVFRIVLRFEGIFREAKLVLVLYVAFTVLKSPLSFDALVLFL
jgi:hypothetical protein